MKFFLNNGNEQLGGYDAPNLSLEYVLYVVQELSDLQQVQGVVVDNLVPVERNGLRAKDAACSGGQLAWIGLQRDFDIRHALAPSRASYARIAVIDGPDSKKSVHVARAMF